MTAADMFAKLMYSVNLIYSNFWLINACDGLMRLDEGLFTDALELSRVSQLALRTLEKAKSEAESVSNLHRAFVANISHELRTPLNSIIGFNSMLLEDETLSEAQREFVSSAIVSAEALLGIIGQILDFAKLESGSDTHQELVVENFEVRAFSFTPVPVRPRRRGERRSLRTFSPGVRLSPPRVPRFQSRHTSTPAFQLRF
jgi:signal transduction histidine kinase